MPQGSILGPLLYIIFTNEIKQFNNKYKHNKFNYSIVTYADDTQLLFTGESNDFVALREFASYVTSNLINFLNSLKLKINVNKTQCSLIGSKSQLNKMDNFQKYIIINDIKLTFKDYVNNLGLTIDSNMKFQNHINNLYSKVFKILTYINKSKAILNFHTRKLLIEHCAFSHLNYCREIWGNLTKENSNLLKKLLNFGSKIIFNQRKYDHCSHLVKALEWRSVDDESIYHLAVLIYKMQNKLFNENVTQSFNFTFIENPFNTRSQTRVLIPKTKTKYGDSSILTRAAKLWTSLPYSIKYARTLNKFKKEIKKYITLEKAVN